jgi:hypothetical protein
MTQDQYGQARGPGYVVHDDAVPDDENEEFSDGQSKPMTRLQKVASALRGGTERDEQDQADGDEFAADQSARDQTLTDRAAGDQAAMANSPISRGSHPEGDYWDEQAASAADRDQAVAVTSPGVPVSETGANPLTRQDQRPGQAGPDATDHPPTQPDMFGTTTRAGNGATSASYPEDQADDAIIPDVPASGAQANGVPASGIPASDVPAGGIPPSGVAADGVPTSGVPAGEATGTVGRHAATASGGTESRPGAASGALGDFSDLTYGDLLPDAAQYTNQWQQVQFKFVDDPQASVTEAADIIAQVTTRLEAAIQERQRAIEERQRAIAEQQRSLRGRWGEGTNADTEGLRETLRMYRTFLDQLIGPRAG